MYTCISQFFYAVFDIVNYEILDRNIKIDRLKMRNKGRKRRGKQSRKADYRTYNSNGTFDDRRKYSKN